MTTATTPADTTLDARRWWALGALVLAMLVLGFDTTILNVALPTLAADLGTSSSEQQWIVDAFLVVFAACMLPAGLLGDRPPANAGRCPQAGAACWWPAWRSCWSARSPAPWPAVPAR
ncbi:MFS transporter [Streptomyces mayteni]